MNTNQLILDLSKELLDDIELFRISGEQLLLKSKRLARLTVNSELDVWLDLELKGYTNDDIGKQYMDKIGRWTDKNEGKGYWIPLSQVEASIEAQKLKLNCLRTPDVSGDKAWVVNNSVTTTINTIGSNISKLSGIKSKVLSHLHDYVVDIYYRFTLENVIDSIFNKYKEDIEYKIVAEARDVIEMLPSVMDRLIMNDSESISQALLTCRRIIDKFADFIYPPSDEKIEIEGNELSLTKDKVKNRINAYITEIVNSKSRKKRLKQNLSNLYERVSTGVHDEVSAEEARALVFNTYLIVGEILNLNK